YGFYFRLQQWSDSFRSPRLLCHGARSSVLRKDRDHEPLSCSSGGVGSPGNLDRIPNSAAHSDTRPCDTSGGSWKCLQSTARIHHLGRFALLPFNGHCLDDFATHQTRSRSSIPHVGLSDRANCLGSTRWIVDCRSWRSRARNFRNRDSHRLDRGAGVLLLAEVRCDGNKSSSSLRDETYLY